MIPLTQRYLNIFETCGILPFSPRGNRAREFWPFIGVILGSGLVFLGLIITSLEISRALVGSCIQRRELANTTSGGIARFFERNRAVAAQLYWPWNAPTIIFGVLITVAGIIGLVTVWLTTFGWIVVFLVMSLLSTAILVYLIGYYSAAVSGLSGMRMSTAGMYLPHFERLSQSSLAFAVLAVEWAILCSILSFIVLAFYDY